MNEMMMKGWMHWELFDKVLPSVILPWVECALRWSGHRSRNGANRPYTCGVGRFRVDSLPPFPRSAGAPDPIPTSCPPAPGSNCALTLTSGSRALGTASPQLTNLRYNHKQLLFNFYSKTQRRRFQFVCFKSAQLKCNERSECNEQ